MHQIAIAFQQNLNRAFSKKKRNDSDGIG